MRVAGIFVASLGVLVATSSVALADQTLPFDGTLQAGGLDHVFLDFEVPAGTAEIQVDHDDMSDADILDWGLNDPSGFRGWGGGNVEPAIVNELAASRSYLAGPIAAGTWRVVIGKAKIIDGSADYHVVVTLRDKATLAAQPERSPYAAAAPLSSEARWYAGDLHVHTIESGDARPPIEEAVTFARSQGLDFVELSDHNTVSQLDFVDAVQKAHDDILLLPGIEYTTYAGHANLIGATKWVDHKIGQPGVDIAGAAGQAHAQKALLSLNHPLYDLGDLCIGCAWKHDLALDAIDGVELVTAGSAELFSEQTIAFWDELCDKGRHLAALGGSDDHSAGQDEGAFSTPVGTPATYVFAKGLSAESILEGIQNGRTVVKFHGVADPMAEMTSDIPVDGDTVHAETTILRAKITGGTGLSARWVKNGAPVKLVEVGSDPFALELTADAPTTGQDRYRIEILDGGRITTITGHLWLEFKSGVVAPGAKAGSASDEGCGCRVRPKGSSEWGWMGGAALAALLFARRRRLGGESVVGARREARSRGLPAPR